MEVVIKPSKEKFKEAYKVLGLKFISVSLKQSVIHPSDD